MDLKQDIFTGPPTDEMVSDEPIPFYANTPDSSQANNYMYNWSAKKLQIIIDHKQYHNSMSEYLASPLSNGPDIDMPVPKAPKSKLQSLFGPKTKPKQPLLGIELHEYLLKHCVNTNLDINVRPLDTANLESVKTTLQDGYHILKQHSARMFSHYLLYGKTLNIAYDLFSVSKLQTQIPHDLTWAKWLNDNIGISNSYAKQLRSIATQFGRYKKFHYLGISFREFLRRKEHIRLIISQYPH